jgi:hypothetical protein
MLFKISFPLNVFIWRRTKSKTGLRIRKMKYAVIIPGIELLNSIPNKTTIEYRTVKVNVMTKMTSGKLKFQ